MHAIWRKQAGDDIFISPLTQLVHIRTLEAYLTLQLYLGKIRGDAVGRSDLVCDSRIFVPPLADPASRYKGIITVQRCRKYDCKHPLPVTTRPVSMNSTTRETTTSQSHVTGGKGAQPPGDLGWWSGPWQRFRSETRSDGNYGTSAFTAGVGGFNPDLT
ncbi:hypothetical protein Bbelb_420940 [Branchiostoma belcheri]|nr:hypothetical protein Bbelb_442050 [Branchiostoma belcheri]KAI8480175.1 hypothetical protein Bbelb_420940 [Branchiostoma belcheri]